MIDLSVEFSGLCLHVLNSPGGEQSVKEVAVLMPDARVPSNKGRHIDGTPAKQHVGWVRFDLANLQPGIPAGGADGPIYEVVHRLDREDMIFDFAQTATGPVKVKTFEVPEMRVVAPDAKLLASALAAQVEKKDPILFRTVLRGGIDGELIGQPRGKRWVMSPALRKGPPASAYVREFAKSVIWTCQVDQPEITVHLAKFDGSSKISHTLKPVSVGGRDTVSIKVGNLCAHNPLEWQDFAMEGATRDEDFKWLYSLYDQSSYENYLCGAELPYPRLEQFGLKTEGNEACIPGSDCVEWTPYKLLS